MLSLALKGFSAQKFLVKLRLSGVKISSFKINEIAAVILSSRPLTQLQSRGLFNVSSFTKLNAWCI